MIWWALACTPDALPCTEEVGYRAPEVNVAALEHANCFRLEMGLQPGSLDPVLDDATQAHAEYMLENSVLDHQEVADNPGFTGEWVWDRLEAAGYALEPGSSWSEVLAEGEGARGSIDRWMNSVYHRVPFTMPGWRAVGFGRADPYVGMTFVMDYPAGYRSSVLYPSDGQTGVPTTFDSDTEWPDPVPDAREVGPPITVTVSDVAIGADSNPHGLSLVDARVEGPDGTLDVVTLQPGDDDFLQYAIAVIPREPLQPLTDYDVEVTVIWGGQEDTVSGSFTTGP